MTTILRDVRITMRDGVELSADIWIPARAAGHPAILEVLPYRKDDYHRSADDALMGAVARRGYVGCRLDVRGTGRSDGIAVDEYTEDETVDMLEVIAWLRTQPWSNGRVAAWGWSYGGFTSLMAAARRPEGLVAIVPCYASDDRWEDDVHQNGGMRTASEQFGYAASMIGMNAMPGGIELERAGWMEGWRRRLEETPPWTLGWLRRGRPSEWRHNSVRFAPPIQIPMLQIAGWCDGYPNPAWRLQESAPPGVERRLLCGPWVHLSPETGYPGPGAAWLPLTLAWLDRFCAPPAAEESATDVERAAAADPAQSILWYLPSTRPPARFPAEWPGEWIADSVSPSLRVIERALFLLPGGVATFEVPAPAPALGDGGASSDRHAPAVIHNVPSIGAAGPLCFGGGSPPIGLAEDLRGDVTNLDVVAAASVTPERAAMWSSAPLSEELLICGRPRLRILVTPDGSEGAIVARLGDQAPDGAITMVTQGILNLAYRSGEGPVALARGEPVEVTIDLRVIAHAFAAGHRIHLQLLGSAFPITWPLATPFALTCTEGASATLTLPQLPRDAALTAGAARAANNPWLRHALGARAPTPTSLAGLSERSYPTRTGEFGAPDRNGDLPDTAASVWDQVGEAGGRVMARFFGGGRAFGAPGVSLYSDEGFTYSVDDATPADTSLKTSVAYELRDGAHAVRAIASGEIRSDTRDFHYRCELTVTLDGKPVHQVTWEERVPRDGR